MTRVGIVTQARTTSTRLPRKVLIPVGEKPLLEHHLDRLRTTGMDVYVATTTNRVDDEVARLATGFRAPVHRGSETDVLARFHGCAVANDLDVIVRVTSDCPLVDGEVIAEAVDDYMRIGDEWLYLSNTLERTFPRGFDFEVFSATALDHAHRHASQGYEREHVTPYFYTNPSSRMRLQNVTCAEDKSRYRVTVDTEDDLALVRSLIEDFGADRMNCSEIVAVLDHHPELVALNAFVRQKLLGQ